ncbi:flagellar hook-basal body complex protein FliE [Sinomonas sp. ASV322]|uniref:flagellar hook-basal body complex protein FliE n=1 Tax=Sinomonas sp. ASV322 TaxID=3041920 RepID=UPI0027DBD4E2|nr:flagellar hook-basal body complex protein FliE [Sinomonas sp. ASV322]MDQ4504069.1 flagellar hook-basal body complex protein FliE [Sinomonas sp. ASV322]
MSVAPVGSIGSAVAGVAAPTVQQTTTAGAGASSGDFAASLAGAVDHLQQLQSASNQLAVQAVTGNLDDIHRATLAATRAQVTFELAAAVRNKGVDAFNEIMRMQG